MFDLLCAQMAIQLTYYRMHKKFVLTYESATTRYYSWCVYNASVIKYIITCIDKATFTCAQC